MLDLGWTEILMIGIVAVVIIGPKDLPKAMHSVAEWMRKLRGMARDFQGQVDDMVKGTELEEVKKAAQGLNRYNIKRQISNVVDPKGQMKKALAETRQAVNQRVDVDASSGGDTTGGGEAGSGEDTSSSGMTTPSLAGNAVAEASIGGGVGMASKLPSIEVAEPTPADDANAVAAMRGDPPAEPAAVPASRPKAGTRSGPAARKTAARKTAPAAGKNGARSTKSANAAKKKSAAIKVVAGAAETPKAKPANARATGSGPAKGRKSASAAKASVTEDASAGEIGAAAEAGGPRVNGDARPTRKRAPARRKPADTRRKTADNGTAPDTASVQDD